MRNPPSQMDLSVDVSSYRANQRPLRETIRYYGKFTRKLVGQFGVLRVLAAALGPKSAVPAHQSVIAPRRRTEDVVTGQYDQGAWTRFNEVLLKRCAKGETLSELLIPTKKMGFDPEEWILCLMEGKLVWTERRHANVYKREKQFRVVNAFIDADDRAKGRTLIEVGCGVGLTLFGLYTQGIGLPLAGYELSTMGVETARQLSEHYRTGIRFSQADLRRDDVEARDQLVLTSFCLEQLKYDTAIVLERILSWRPRRVIHYEPVIELFHRTSIRDVFNILYIKHCDYQDSLLSTLRKMEKEKRVRIVHAGRAGYGGQPVYEASCVVWEPL